MDLILLDLTLTFNRFASKTQKIVNQKEINEYKNPQQKHQDLIDENDKLVSYFTFIHKVVLNKNFSFRIKLLRILKQKVLCLVQRLKNW